MNSEHPAIAAAGAAALALLLSPYLASLTLTVPDRDNHRWWRWQRPPARTVASTGAVAVSLAALAAGGVGVTAALAAFVTVALLSAPLVVIDIECHRLPNRLVFAAGLGAAGLLVVAAGNSGEWRRLLGAVEASAALFAGFCLLVLLRPGAFGFGDVKLIAVLAGLLGWWGWLYVYYGLFAGFLLGAAAGVTLVVTRRSTLKSRLAFGPALIYGTFLVIALHRLA